MLFTKISNDVIQGVEIVYRDSCTVSTSVPPSTSAIRLYFVESTSERNNNMSGTIISPASIQPLLCAVFCQYVVVIWNGADANFIYCIATSLSHLPVLFGWTTILPLRYWRRIFLMGTPSSSWTLNTLFTDKPIPSSLKRLSLVAYCGAIDVVCDAHM